MNKTDVVIIGGGPVGLYLGGRIIQAGLTCRILEKRTEVDQHSKSLGIHPTSMELFDKAGIEEKFITEGIIIKKGVAFWNREKAGEITFEKCPKPFQFILALPQWQTETILEKWVLSLDPDSVIRGAEVTGLEQDETSVTVHFNQNGRAKSILSKFAAACDGKNSKARSLLDISFDGKPYPDTYIMGDFDDNTDFGTDAAVYLHEDGLIESFPLPNGMRRWVVKTSEYIQKPTSNMLKQLVYQRLGHHLDEKSCVMISSFGVQHYLAETFHKNRVLLAGDSAHIVSPIGGQGMNLGWMDAEQCVEAIIQAEKNPTQRKSLFENYSSKQMKMARQTARRAELNMWLGRQENSGLAVRLLVKMMLKRPFSHLLARIFTMRGLGRWVI